MIRGFCGRHTVRMASSIIPSSISCVSLSRFSTSNASTYALVWSLKEMVYQWTYSTYFSSFSILAISSSFYHEISYQSLSTVLSSKKNHTFLRTTLLVIFLTTEVFARFFSLVFSSKSSTLSSALFTRLCKSSIYKVCSLSVSGDDSSESRTSTSWEWCSAFETIARAVAILL